MDYKMENTVALNAFGHAIGLMKLKKGHMTNVIAVVDGQTKYDELTEVFYTTSNEYGDPEISIMWNLHDSLRRDLGLYGMYSSSFNHFSYNDSDKELTIRTTDATIYVSSKN